MIHHGIVIIGGGPVGLTMALTLAKQGKKVLVLDESFDKTSDSRVLALSYASQQILKKYDAWVDNPTAIDCVRMSHYGLGISDIRADLLNLDHLGYTVAYADLCTSLLKHARENEYIELVKSKVTRVHDNKNLVTVEYSNNCSDYEVLTAELVIMAEGGKLLAEETKKISHDYQQQALIAHIEVAKPSSNVAYERFAKKGPLVLLPFKQHYVMVWSLPTEVANHYKSIPQSLIEELDAEFTSRLGGARLISAISGYPLKLVQVKQRLGKRVVLIGNSAQTVHPISAQGLNLGLRDVAALSQLLSRSSQLDLSILSNFDKVRNKDANAVIGFTHFLATFLERQGPLINNLRGAGLITLSNLPLIQNFIARSLIFGI